MVFLCLFQINANIVELALDNMSEEMAETCARLQLKTMIMHGRDDPNAFRRILAWQVDMANVDHGDVFLHYRDEFVAGQAVTQSKFPPGE